MAAEKQRDAAIRDGKQRYDNAERDAKHAPHLLLGTTVADRRHRDARGAEMAILSRAGTTVSTRLLRHETRLAIRENGRDVFSGHVAAVGCFVFVLHISLFA